jgi:hypothetical protein
MRQSTDRRAPRPVGPAAAALSKMLSRAWSLPPQRNFVEIGLSAANLSALVVSQTAGKAAAHA